MKKKILVLTSRFPYPVIGGDRLRIYRICKELAKEFDLTLLSLCATKREFSAEVPRDGVFSAIRRIYHPNWKGWFGSLLAAFSRIPLQVGYYRSREFANTAEHLLASHDLCFAHLIRVGDMVKDVPGLKFLEMTDAISMNYGRVIEGRASKVEGDWRRVVYKYEYGRLLKYERAIIDSFDKSFVVSDVDRHFLFADLPGALQKVDVVGNGVDVGQLPYQFCRDGRDIAYIGNMGSLQNLDAALFFASEVLPLIRQHLPETRFRVIGRVTNSGRRRLTALEGVDVTGEVSHVPSAAVGCGVGVCPVRLAAGVQNKILEYMALGLPTVTTSVGLEGLSATCGSDLLVADDPASFADAVLALLRSRTYAETLAESGRIYVEKNHSWESALAPLIHRIKVALNSVRPIACNEI